MTATSRPIGSTGSTCRWCICMETMFYEDHPDQFEKNVTRRSPPRPTASRATRSRAASTRPTADPEGFHGPRITLEAPTMPTMGLTMERLAGGATTRRQRSTANRVFCPVEGSGESIVGNERFAWRRGDTFAVAVLDQVRASRERRTRCCSDWDEPLMRFAKHYASRRIEGSAQTEVITSRSSGD